jgi:hypothetical protein
MTLMTTTKEKGQYDKTRKMLNSYLSVLNFRSS